jgi:acyl-coenzyme A synthetase/AMP-(fatty) acid ligase
MKQSETTLDEMFAVRAHKQGDQLYLRHKKTGVTFREVIPILITLASQLPALVHLRVVILLPDSLNAAMLHLECFRKGATMIPLSPLVPPAHLAYIMKLLRPDIVFTTGILRTKFEYLLERAVVILVEDVFPPRFQIVDSCSLRDGGDRRSPVRAILFTSGTTGSPKGVCLSESSLLGAAAINSTILALDRSRRSLVMVPLYDYYGMIQLYSHALSNATCTFGESGQFPKATFQVITTQAITDLVLVPFTLRAILDFVEACVEGAEYRQAWHSVKCVASSSDRLSVDLLRRTFALSPALRFVDVYGLTEAGRACFRVICSGSHFDDSIGQASPAMEVSVDAPAGETGEIVIRGKTVMLGYVQDIVDEQIHYSAVNEIRTGDEGYLGCDNEIHLLGRVDHQLNMYGEKLHPSEIELSVNKLPGVRDSLTWLDRDQEGRNKIVLSVVANEREVSKEQILKMLRERIPRIFLPEVISFVDSIERTEIGGKIIRPKC